MVKHTEHKLTILAIFKCTVALSILTLFPRNLVRAGLWQGRLKFFKNRLLYLIAVKYNIKLTGLTIFKCTVQ